MNTKVDRFFTFLMKEKTRNFFAFLFYASFIFLLMETVLPLPVEIISLVVQMFIILFALPLYMLTWMEKISNKYRGKLVKNILQEIKKISKELVMFIPVLLLSICITSFMMIGNSANQTSINTTFFEAPIYNSISIIIIGPIVEEFIFRLLPYKFIKNKFLYIILSTVVFAGMHVIGDSNALYYIWFYMMRPLYYGYRYYKTQDVCVTISMHSLNNLIATILMILST